MSLPLGGLTLMDASKQSPRAALKIVRETLSGSGIAKRLEDRTFYAVAALSGPCRLHMSQRNYPLKVTHGYVIPRATPPISPSCRTGEHETLISIDAVSAARRPLLAYGAVVLDEIIRRRGRGKSCFR